jgi:predicted RNA-binding protein with PIN domain
MKRSDSYDERLSQKLKNLEFAQEYLLSLVESDEDEQISVEDALRIGISKMGTTDFAKLVGENKANVDKFLKGNRVLKEETLNRYLRPFGLRIKKALEKVA